MFFILNLIGLGFGPPFIGWLIDQLAQFNFTHPGPHHIVTALGQAFAAPTGARFAAACPGGMAPKGSAPAALGACKSALISATREGVIIGYAFNLWGAFHYFLASFGVARALANGRAGAAS
jgi:hypothetical protein